MAQRGSAAAGCKDDFSPLSSTKDLGLAASDGASMRGVARFVNSWPKAILAAGFFALTNYVIFEDVLRHGAVITTDHLLSFAVLVGTFAAGHSDSPSQVAKVRR